MSVNKSFLWIFSILLMGSFLGCLGDKFPDPPIAKFSADPTECLAPCEVILTDNSENATGFTWIVESGGSFQDSLPIYTFENPGSFTIQLVVENSEGLTDTASQEIEVLSGEMALAAFEISNDSCIAPCQVCFSNQSLQATSYQWDFGDGTDTTFANPCHTYNSPGSYLVTLTATGDYSEDETSRIVTILPEDITQPVASFSFSPDSCQAPCEICFTNQSINATSYTWDFGDGADSTSESPCHFYNAPGSYLVTLTAMGESSDDEFATIVTILPEEIPQPIASFSFSPDSCRPPCEICFTNQSANATSYLWNFGDGGQSQSQDPCYEYLNPGNYLVQLTATGPESSHDTTILVQVLPKLPEADFSFSNDGCTVPCDISFSNQSTNWQELIWNFGDASSLVFDQENPSHTYTIAGSYPVTLTAIGSDGILDTVVKTVNVLPIPSPNENFVCGDLWVDVRDGQSYTTVLIGTQCWMAENLNIGMQVSGGTFQIPTDQCIQKYCLGDDSLKCIELGALYQWDEAMQDSETGGVQGVCPVGWHIPTDTEWRNLEMELGMPMDTTFNPGWRGVNAAEKLKSELVMTWCIDSILCNQSGFSALKSGYWDIDGTYKPDSEAAFWTSSLDGGATPWIRKIGNYRTDIERAKGLSTWRNFGRSIRCIKD